MVNSLIMFVISFVQQIYTLNFVMKKKLERQGSSESEQSEYQQKIKGKKSDRKIIMMENKKRIRMKSKNKIYINLSMTHYQIIADIAQELGWIIQYSPSRGDWDVLWTDSEVQPQILIKMSFFQKISHFPGIHVLARKNLLGQSFMQMRTKFPQEYNFFPLTWMLPSQFHELRLAFNQKQTYIVKPEASCQGKGIFLTKNLNDVQNGNHYVVQQYIRKPYLIDGLKFDLRIYVLLCGTNPMRLYIYQEGLARFATQKYVEPNSKNLDEDFIHLTNYAINKNNPKFIYNKSPNNMGIGHKRSLTSIFKLMQKNGVNICNLKKKIYDAIIKTFIVGIPFISHQYNFCQPDDDYRNMCFHILGIDVMLDENVNPYVLQVNHTPSFATDTPLDHKIKSSLIRDTLILMNINKISKNQLLKKSQQYYKRDIFQSQQKKERARISQQIRDQYQKNHLGSFVKLYPTNDSSLKKYKKFIKEAEVLYFAENNVLRHQMSTNRVVESLNKKKDQNKMQKEIFKSQIKRYSDSTIITILSKKKVTNTINVTNRQQQKINNSSIFDFSQNQIIRPFKVNLIQHLPRIQNPKRQFLQAQNKKIAHMRHISRLLSMKPWQGFEKSTLILQDRAFDHQKQLKRHQSTNIN